MLSQLSQQGIALRIATKKLAAEEAPASYKDVSQVGRQIRSCCACCRMELLAACMLQVAAKAVLVSTTCHLLDSKTCLLHCAAVYAAGD